MMIPRDAHPTEFPGVYRFRARERYLVAITYTPNADEYYAAAETIHGSLQNAIDRRTELLDEYRDRYGPIDEPGPPRRRKRPQTVVRRRPPPKDFNP